MKKLLARLQLILGLWSLDCYTTVSRKILHMRVWTGYVKKINVENYKKWKSNLTSNQNFQIKTSVKGHLIQREQEDIFLSRPISQSILANIWIFCEFRKKYFI